MFGPYPRLHVPTSAAAAADGAVPVIDRAGRGAAATGRGAGSALRGAAEGRLPGRLGLGVGPGRGPRLRLSLLTHGGSVPRTSVAPVDSMPPVPWATATRASGTWFTDSPRSWRTASTMRNMPRIPGWQAD